MMVSAVNDAGLSASLMVNTPDVVIGSFVSNRSTLAVLMTALPFEPRMLTVIVLAVPSALFTVNVSV